MKLHDLDIIVYDCEVFAHDWLFVFLDDGIYTHFWNEDIADLKSFVESRKQAVFAGFNNKRYDQYILKAIYAGCDPEQVKEVNDWIVGTDNVPWEHPYLQGVYIDIHNTDLMDDTQLGTSLKSIEGHLGLDIQESSVPFDYPDKLSKDQRKEVLKYCIHDVESTAELCKLRKDYLETKLHLASLNDIDQYKALNSTDPKLAAMLFRATPLDEPKDERDYVFPDCLDYDLVPAKVTDFFAQITDKKISDAELFASKLEIEIGGCPVTYAFGGIHGALPTYRLEATENTLILNYDVSSLYPSLMIEYGYVSRAVPSPEIFAQVRQERFAAKKAGDKKTANALKSPLNKAYGAMGNQYNAMYDPKMKLSVCVSGQLSITTLACAYARLKGVKIIQVNTDGIMISCPKEHYEQVIAINKEWENRTHLELEEDQIELIHQKDVNNYVMRKKDGSVKIKGGYLVRGISPIGAWSINNNTVIVAEAIKQYLLDNTPIEDTINSCSDPFKFQHIAKVGHKYSCVYQLLTDGTKIPVQKCNRVFASTDERLGKLYKIKAADNSIAKVENLPEHCLIANNKMPEINEIDKSYYIAIAKKRAQDFIGEDMVSKTTDYSKLNVYQKLAIARRMFVDANVKKSGINTAQCYEYFELKDIVPVQTKIFDELGLVEKFVHNTTSSITQPDGSVTVTENYAVSEVINCNEPSEKITFTLPWGEVPPIISKSTGKEVTTPIQRLGSEQTYMRRYLKMQILDIVEADTVDDTSREEIEASLADEKVKAPSAQEGEPKPSKPKAKSERETIKAKATDANGKVSKIQLNALKRSIKNVGDEYGKDHPEVMQYIAELSAKTNKLENITKLEAEEAIKTLGEMKAKFEAGEK